MPRKTLVALAITSLVLAGCGGGSGSGSSNSGTGANNPPPTASRTDAVETGYFAYFDGEAAETADHVTYVMIPDWGDWDTQVDYIRNKIIAQLQEAKARNITKAIVSVGFLTWTREYAPKGKAGLQAFRTQLQALGLLDMVVGTYPIDEPDLKMGQGLTEATLESGLMDVRGVFPDKRMMVIYGVNGRPAQNLYTDVGHDEYGHGVVTTPLLPGQREILIIGGGNPWREDPNQVADYALANPEVLWVMNFIYGDTQNGLGIRNNGMLPVYRAVGIRLKSSGPH